MAKQFYVTNNHTDAQEFAVDGGGFETVEPGDTKRFALAARDSAFIKGLEHASLITISETKTEAEQVKSKSEENRTASGSA